MVNTPLQTEIRLDHGPIERLFVKIVGGEVASITMVADPDIEIVNSDNGLIADIDKQLNNYMRHAHNQWQLNLAQQGTPFQRKVWHSLQMIPLGKTRSYGQIATELASSARAVGNACRANPYLLVVPCHRVTAKSGLGGFAGESDGQAVAIKQWLLDHERS